MFEEKCNGSNVLVALLIGAAVGGGIALLTAPRSGRETRDKLRGLAGETSERIRKIAEEAEERIAEVLQEGKNAVAEKRDMVKAAVEAGREAMATEKAKHV
ncbi:MAG: YtxH domain-containing protein [Desulfuromonadales bacterium]|nr:YtxH domain-containing protein [Desulfuromonadales bacterium]MDZ4185089.1 YtxH domain-containing protein [Desulfuromonadales bacterium]